MPFPGSPAADITVAVSSPLRDFCGGEAEIRVRAPDLRALLVELERSQPRLHRAICDETGRMRRHVNLFINELHMSERGGLDATLAPGDVVTILPAVSGGKT
jgi:molybdopterin converting factor small subunit